MIRNEFIVSSLMHGIGPDPRERQFLLTAYQAYHIAKAWQLAGIVPELNLGRDEKHCKITLTPEFDYDGLIFTFYHEDTSFREGILILGNDLHFRAINSNVAVPPEVTGDDELDKKNKRDFNNSMRIFDLTRESFTSVQQAEIVAGTIRAAQIATLEILNTETLPSNTVEFVKGRVIYGVFGEDHRYGNHRVPDRISCAYRVIRTGLNIARDERLFDVQVLHLLSKTTRFESSANFMPYDQFVIHGTRDSRPTQPYFEPTAEEEAFKEMVLRKRRENPPRDDRRS